MAKKNNNEERNFVWGEGRTAMFIAPTQSGSFELLDCRFREDREKLHEICGSKSKISRTGQSGSEIIFNMGSLIPVGGYRTDTANLDFYNPVEILEDVEIAFPYNWYGDKNTPLRENPVVIRKWTWESTYVIFCPYGQKLWDLMELLEDGKMPTEAPELRTKKFVRKKAEKPEFLRIYFLDLLDYKASQDPWEFIVDDLPEYVFPAPKTELEKQMSIHLTESGKVVTLQKIEGEYFGCDIQPIELLLRGKLQIPGWESAGPNLYYKIRDEKVTLLPFFPAEEYWKRVNRLLRSYPNPKKTSWQAENIWPTSWAPGTIISYGRVMDQMSFFTYKEWHLKETKKYFKRLMLIKALDYVTMMVTSLEYQPQNGKEE